MTVNLITQKEKSWYGKNNIIFVAKCPILGVARFLKPWLVQYFCKFFSKRHKTFLTNGRIAPSTVTLNEWLSFKISD